MTIKKIRLLTVTFDTQISAEELAGFRGSIVAKVGREFEWFHNHNNQEGGFHHRYPIIQYKRHRGKPMLVCIEEGIEEVHRFFAQPDWTLNINGRITPIRVDKLEVKQVPLQIVDIPKRYKLHNWVGLNDANQKTYNQLDSLTEKVAFLEQKIGASIIAFIRAMQWKAPRRFEVKIIDFSAKKTRLKNRYTKTAFDVEFKADIILPNHIGLGKSVSVGYGKIFQIRENTSQK